MLSRQLLSASVKKKERKKIASSYKIRFVTEKLGEGVTYIFYQFVKYRTAENIKNIT